LMTVFAFHRWPLRTPLLKVISREPIDC